MQTFKNMHAIRRILIVDDDGALRQSLAEQLELHGEFVTVQCDTAGAALEGARHDRFDAIILDVGLPDMDGRDVCRLLRGAAINVPIIMLTAADSEGDTVQGLDAGADDYVTKPFRLNVLLARLRAHLRQSDHRDDAVFAIGPYTFQPSAKLMTDSSRRKKVRLTEKETAILRYLYHAGSRPIGRATLLGEVWGYNAAVTTHTLETHVYRLRQKIERDPAKAEILVTEPGGYRLLP
jgi:DNA-binding response OmpR family regulator